MKSIKKKGISSNGTVSTVTATLKVYYSYE